MPSPKPKPRKLTAAQKKAGIKLVKGWKKPEVPDPVGIFRCFASPANVKGKLVKIGVADAISLKRMFVLRGMTNKRGLPKRNLSWQEKLVIGLRTWTTKEDFNHEWWGAKTIEPDWVRKVEEIYQDSWLYYPSLPKHLGPRLLGAQVGYYLALGEAKLELAVTDRAYLQKMEAVELERARRPFEKKERKKVSVVLAGYESWKDAFEESHRNFSDLRREVMSMVGALAPRKDFGEFIQGLATGEKRASRIDLKNQLSEYNQREEVVEVLLEYWESIQSLPNRTEISRYIRTRLPDGKRERLKNEKAEPWKSFCVWVRDIYDNIGLSPSGKGAPKKNREKGKG